jgi:hypothetical protein
MALALALAVLNTGCRLQVDVNVDVAEDGSGEVEVVIGVDDDALDRIGGDLAAVLDVDALAADGWVIDGPAVEGDGFTRVRIRHRFGSPRDAAEVFALIAPQDGPFQDFAVTRERSTFETRVGFRGRVDFGAGVPSLDGSDLESIEDLEARLGDSLSRLIQVRVSARLPGEVTSNATTKADNGAVWQIGFGEGGVDLEATGTTSRVGTLVAIGVAAVAAVLLLLYALVRLAMRSGSSQRRATPA